MHIDKHGLLVLQSCSWWILSYNSVILAGLAFMCMHIDSNARHRNKIVFLCNICSLLYVQLWCFKSIRNYICLRGNVLNCSRRIWYLWCVLLLWVAVNLQSSIWPVGYESDHFNQQLLRLVFIFGITLKENSINIYFSLCLKSKFIHIQIVFYWWIYYCKYNPECVFLSCPFTYILSKRIPK